MPSTLSTADVALKNRYYIYRRYTLHQRTGAATADDLYWQIKGGTPAEVIASEEKAPKKTRIS